jgi:hypothetical protein
MSKFALSASFWIPHQRPDIESRKAPSLWSTQAVIYNSKT